MAERTYAEARDLFWLLTRSDATIFPTSPGTPVSMQVNTFIYNSLQSYWDAFVDYKGFNTFVVAQFLNTITVATGGAGKSPAIDLEAAYILNTDSTSDDYRKRTPLERVEFHEIRRRQRNDAMSGVSGTPTSWCPVRLISTNDSWTVHFNPWAPSGGLTFEIHYKAGTDVSSSLPGRHLTDAEFFWVVQMAAAKAALVIGRKEDVPLILQGVPDPILMRSDIALYEAIPSLRSSEISLGR